MRISAQLDETYYNPYSNTNDVGAGAPGRTLSAQLNEPLVTDSVFNTLGCQINEPLDAIPTATLGPQIYSQFVTQLIAIGVDLATGQSQVFEPGDVVVRADGLAYSAATGIQGWTGVQGVAGLPGAQGATGLFGNTGLRGLTGVTVDGITGISIIGVTGLRGDTGVLGITGLSPTGILGIQGIQITGITGIQGITGIIGSTGSSPSGATGLQGMAPAAGSTGVQGLTGASSFGFNLSGATGINIGGTGLQGSTGLVGPVGIISVTTLNVQNSLSSTTASYILPANTLNVNSQQLEFITWGQSAADNTSTTLTITFGGSSIFSSTFSGTAGLDFYLRGLIIRLTGSTQENLVSLIGRDGIMDAERSSTSVSLAADQTLQLSLTGAGVGYQFNALIVRKVSQ
jgi:hypothetical protein